MIIMTTIHQPPAKSKSSASPGSSRNIGIDVPLPAKTCTDMHCPFHGTLRVHGRKFTGIVTSSKAMKTVTVAFEWKRKITKYERFETRRTKVKAHASPCLDPHEGAVVTIMETRPLSKTKNFVVIQVHDQGATQKTSQTPPQKQ